MSDVLPVVLIETPNGPARLNESDFDPAKHKLWRDPLDHDGNKVKGGTAVPPSELSVLRNEYKAVIGKGPSPKWDAETLRAKIAAHKAE
jgi:hypothetical protein